MIDVLIDMRDDIDNLISDLEFIEDDFNDQDEEDDQEEDVEEHY